MLRRCRVLAITLAFAGCGDRSDLAPVAPPEEARLMVRVVYCETDTPVEGVVLTLTSATDTLAGVTDYQGVHEFGAVLTADYRLDAVRDLAYEDVFQINGLDAALVFRLAEGLEALSDPCLLVGADADMNGIVDMEDAMLLSRFLAFMPSGNVGNWSFMHFDPNVTVDRDVELTVSALLVGDVDSSWPLTRRPTDPDPYPDPQPGDPPPPPNPQPGNPPAPVILSVYSVDDWKVTLTWSLNYEADFNSYELYRDGLQFKVRAWWLDHWNDTTVKPETEYSYQMVVVDDDGERSGSNIVTVTTPAPTLKARGDTTTR